MTRLIRGGVVLGSGKGSLLGLFKNKKLQIFLLCIFLVAGVVVGILQYIHHRNNRVAHHAGRAAELEADGKYEESKVAIDEAAALAPTDDKKAELLQQKAAACEAAKDTECVVRSHTDVADMTSDESLMATSLLSLSLYLKENNMKSDSLEALKKLESNLRALPEQKVDIRGQDTVSADDIRRQIEEIEGA